MREPYEAYIKVMVLPDTIGDGCEVSAEIKGGTVVRVKLEDLVMEPPFMKRAREDSADEVAALRKELEALRNALDDARTDVSYWNNRALNREARVFYLAGALDAAQAFTGKELPCRDLAELCGDL